MSILKVIRQCNNQHMIFVAPALARYDIGVRFSVRPSERTSGHLLVDTRH